MFGRPSLRVALRVALAGAVVLVGCNALIGEKDIHLDPNGPGGGGPDGGNDGNVTPTDGATNDATNDGGGECGNTQSDPKNCGRCGRDCLGSTCSEGRCAPIVLAQGLNQTDGIALGPNDVYVTTRGDDSTPTGTVISVPKAGGAAVTLATGEKLARGVAVSGTTLYWANGDFEFTDGGTTKGGIWKCTLPACTNKTLFAPGDFAAFPVIQGSALYFDSMNTDDVRRVPILGGAAISLCSSNKPFGLAVDDSYAYYTSSQNSVYRALVDGGSKNSEQAVGPTPGNFVGFLALDDQRVYWAYTDTDGSGKVTSTTKMLGGLTNYGTAADNIGPVGIAVDKDYVYWSTDGTASSGQPNGDGKVFACKKAGCDAQGPILLSNDNLFGGPMTSDDKAVYWVEFGSFTQNTGRVRKVAKP